MYTFNVQFIQRTPRPRCVYVGTEGERNVQQIKFFDLPQISNVFYTLHVQKDEGEGADLLTLDENNTVTISRVITSQPGEWRAWLVAQVGTSIVWKSETFKLVLFDLPDIDSAISQKYPTAIEDALARINQAERYIESVLEGYVTKPEFYALGLSVQNGQICQTYEKEDDEA